jgi:hypothetical protein
MQVRSGSSTEGASVKGRCLCGAVRFESDTPPRRVTHCHCDTCRRALGAVVATFAAFESEAVRWSGDLTRYDSSEVGWRGFCARCGSSVCFGYLPRPERIYIALGIFDDPHAYPAGFHDYRSSAIEWLVLDEHLPDVPAIKA